MARTKAQKHFEDLCLSAYTNMALTLRMTPAQQADYMRELIAAYRYVLIILPEPGKEHLSAANWIKGMNPRNPKYLPPIALTTAFYVLNDDYSNDFIVAYGDQFEGVQGRKEIAAGLWHVTLAELQESVTVAAMWAREREKQAAGRPSALDHFDLSL